METKTLTIDTKDLAADPAKVKSEHHFNMAAYGVITGALCAALSWHFGKGAVKLKPSVLVSGATVLGTLGGVVLGSSLKTREEGLSESLMKAANSGQFVKTLKDEMKSRERSEYAEGLITGFAIGI